MLDMPELADPDCIFCHIVAGDLPASRVAQTERSVAFMDINPATDSHLWWCHALSLVPGTTWRVSQTAHGTLERFIP
jgi:hypothetical protein